MDITYEEALANVKKYVENKPTEHDFSLHIEKPINPPLAYESAEMLEGEHTFREKMYFVQSLLFDNSITITHKGNELLSLSITNQTDLGMVDEFRNTPSALRFLVNAVYSIFLKNSLPL